MGWGKAAGMNIFSFAYSQSPAYQQETNTSTVATRKHTSINLCGESEI